MSDRILVINPNSTEAVTRGIDAAMEPLRMNGGPVIECVTLKDGPPGIENQAHVEQVVGPIGRMVTKRDNDCSAFVIACYSDPGLHAAREITTKRSRNCRVRHPDGAHPRPALRRDLDPQEVHSAPPALCRANGRGRPHGRRPRHRPRRRRAFQRGHHFARMAEVAAELRDEDGATCWSWAAPAWPATATGCSAMSALPVVEPSQAAVAMAIGRSRLGWSA